MAQTLPIFPLGQVLMPGRPLPLRIFELRYRAMIADLARVAEIDTAPEARARRLGSFGVVLLVQGHEVESRWTVSPDQHNLSRVGTVAEILKVTGRIEDGYEVLAVGSRRFTLGEFLPGKPYLRAEIQYLDEPAGVISGALAQRVRRLYDEYAELIIRRTGRPAAGMREIPPENANLLSYHLASTLPLRASERQQVLAEPNAGSRLNRIAGLLHRELALLRATGTVAAEPGAVQLPVRPN